jgi:acetyltransferase-like isoleucine patch superfamily enzyme
LRDLQYFSTGQVNSMHYWKKISPPIRTMFNFIVIQIGRYIPSIRIKNFLYGKLLGIRLGKDVGIGLMAMVDIFHPWSISIGDGSIIGYNSTILCHEFLPHEYRLGQVQIGKDVLIGANVTILAGVKIGDGAMISANSLVNQDIPPYTVAAGVPAVVVKERNGGKAVSII